MINELKNIGEPERISAKSNENRSRIKNINYNTRTLNIVATNTIIEPVLSPFNPLTNINYLENDSILGPNCDNIKKIEVLMLSKEEPI